MVNRIAMDIAMVITPPNLLGMDLGFAYANRKYVVGSKSLRPDIQKPRQMENAVRDIQCHLW